MSKVYKTTIVDSLPQEGEKDIIYLILDDGVFNAYLYVGSAWIQVGEEYEIATTTTDGLMSASDKNKLDLIGGGYSTQMETVSVPSGDAKNALTIPLSRAGYWLVITMVYFPGNSGGGWRYTYITDSVGGSRIDRMAEDNGPNVGDTTYNSRIVTTLLGNQTYYLYAQQNSGASLSCRVQTKAIFLTT